MTKQPSTTLHKNLPYMYIHLIISFTQTETSTMNNIKSQHHPNKNNYNISH